LAIEHALLQADPLAMSVEEPTVAKPLANRASYTVAAVNAEP